MFLSESRLTVLTGCHDAARGIVQCNGIPQPNTHYQIIITYYDLIVYNYNDNDNDNENFI